MRIILLAFLLFSCGCSLQGAQKENENYSKSTRSIKSITLKKVNSFALDSDSTLLIGGLLSRFVISKDGTRMAFYDMLNSHFLITDSKGNVMYTIGSRGKGPKEFVQVLGWNFDEHNNLIVYDEAQRQLKIFGPYGGLKQTLSIFDGEELVAMHRYLFARDSLIYMGILETKYSSLDREDARKSKLVAVFDYRGKRKRLIGKYDPYASEANYYGIYPVFYIDAEENKLYSSHGNSYRIQIFDLNNDRRIAYFGYKNTHFRESNEAIEYYYSRSKIMKMTLNQSFPTGLFITSNYILHFFQNLSEKWNQTRDLQYKDYFLTIYDKKSHKVLSELELPYLLGAVHNDQLYLVKSKNPENYTIGVYELTK